MQQKGTSHFSALELETKKLEQFSRIASNYFKSVKKGSKAELDIIRFFTKKIQATQLRVDSLNGQRI